MITPEETELNFLKAEIERLEDELKVANCKLSNIADLLNLTDIKYEDGRLKFEFAPK